MAVAVEFSSDNAKLLRGMAQLEKKTEDLKRKYAELGKTGRKAGDDTGRSMKRATADGFGTQAQGQIRSYVKGLLGVSTAIGIITSAFRTMNRAAEEAAQKNLASELGLAELTQLSGGDPKKLQSLISQAKGLFSAGGASSLDQAARTVFSLESAGIPQAQQALFGRLYGISQTPDVLAKAAVTLQTSLGRDETGDIRGIVSKGFAASAFAPSRTGPLLEAAARSGASAKTLGLTDEEVIAATTVLAKATGSAELGGTQVSALLDSLIARKGFIGLSLQESIRRVESLNLAPDELLKFFGRKEASKGFAVLRDQSELFQEVLGKVQRAPEIDLIGQLISAREQQPGLTASLRQRQAEAAKEIARGPLGVEQLLDKARIDRFVAEGEARGDNRFLLSIQELKARADLVFKNIGIGPSRLQGLQVEPGLSPAELGETREIIDASAEKRLINSAEKIENASGLLEHAAQMLERAMQVGGPALKNPQDDR